LIVVKQDPPSTKLLPEDLVLRTQIFDDLLLLPINPPGDDKEKELPRLEDDVHGWPDAIMEAKPIASGTAQQRSIG
jgi:hypothetical protein